MKKTINMEDAEDLIFTKILTEYYKLENNQPKTYKPFLLEGTYGIGKTSILTKLRLKLEKATEQEWGFIKWNMATISMHTIQGVPRIDEVDNGFTMLTDSYLPTEDNYNNQAQGIKFPKYGILYLDEINHIEDPNKISVLHSLLQENRLNNTNILDSWFIVAAGNSQGHLGLYYKLPPAVRDRLLIYDVENTLNEQIEYYKSVNLHPTLLNYIEYKQNQGIDITQTFDPKKEISDSESSYVFITRRSILDTSNDIKAYEQYSSQLNNHITSSSDNLLLNLICGSLGEEYGTEFYNFYINKNHSTNPTPTINNNNISSISFNNSTTKNTIAQPTSLSELIQLVERVEFKDNNVTLETKPILETVIKSNFFSELKDINIINQYSSFKILLCLIFTKNITLTSDIYNSLSEQVQSNLSTYTTINNIRLN